MTQLFDALGGVADTRVVGGAVRNSLLLEPIDDIDVATVATPETVARVAKAAGFHVYETGLVHGTLTITIAGQPFEVTTLREDVTTDGRRATVRFTDDWARDAGRRDFTMNALYVDRDGVGSDYVGGYRDCLDHHVRFIGDAGQRILEDHLRILRFFRFHAAYGRGPFDAEGLAASRAHKALLAGLAVERVQHELFRLMGAQGAVDAVDILVAEDFLAPFLPMPLSSAGFRALARVEAAAGRSLSPVLGLVALVQFDVDAFSAAATALKLSRKRRDRGLAALRAAREMPPRSAPHVRVLLYEHGDQAFCDGLLLALAQGVDVIDVGRILRDARAWVRPRFPVSGADLLEQGAPSGPEIGVRLKRLEGVWRDSDFLMDKDTLLALDRAHLEKDA
ncbi:CCA tRNA nucleotidyltransferase [Acuticoccus kandeliae]|uniref:CCA tRNA nucleotidyltransferase n=1 Tax=Acuticoccus kandeliae TaxID=2073160 RepID=UPI000D3E18EB|nr:CCA tRNA nucleotidyltransferase [Acuticoccus kandeliae]